MNHRLLFLSEGDPETLDSWSGVSFHLIQALRKKGYEISGRDISERGLLRALAIASSWAPSRRRWAARYHFGSIGFAARTWRARRQLRHGSAPWDAIVQIGATFDTTGGAPTFMYCDSNARIAEANRPYGDVALLTHPELARMVRREARVYAGMAHIFTMSELVRGSMIRDFGLPESRVSTVWAAANLDPAVCQSRTASMTKPGTILFVGRHWEAKGGPVLLDAFIQARATHRDLRLLIVGCTPPVGHIPGVEVVGSVNKSTPEGLQKMLSLYREADLFCMPSRFDMFGVVFVEAMLHGVACIGSRHAAMPEIIAHGETGWVIPIDAVAGLRDLLVSGFADREALARMGMRGRDRALRLFTWDAVAERMNNAMAAVLRRRQDVAVANPTP
jgi:glycosyltransferase involved in cell wall biosynthesis